MSNPLLDKVIVQPIIRSLPSRGLLYTDNELDESVSNGEIKIYPLTGMDEIKLKSPDLMHSGEAIEAVIRNRCPQVNDPKELFVQDLDYILFVMRIVSYGNKIHIDHAHRCDNLENDEDPKTHKYEINLDSILQNVKKINPNEISRRFSLTVSTNQIVKFKPLRYKHMLQLLADVVNDDFSEKTAETIAVDGVLQAIESVDDIKDREQIREWLQNIPTIDWNKINEQLKLISEFGTDFTATVKCKDCGKDTKILVNTNPVVFFTQS